MKIFKKIKIGQTATIYIALILIVIVFMFMSPVFMSIPNMLSILRQVTVLGIVATGMTFVAITGGVDLSVGSMISLIGVVVALANTKFGLNIWVSALIGITIAVLIGALNGLIVTETGIAPMIATLGMSQVLKGISFTICGGLPVGGIDSSFAVLGQGYLGPIPIPVIILVVIVGAGIFLLQKMYVGRYFYAIGGNDEAARLSGIKIKQIRKLAFVLCGLFTGIASLIMLSRVNSAQPTTGIGYEMDVMTSVIVGGVSMAGGTGSVNGTIAGVLIIGVLNNGLTLAGSGEYVKIMVKGAVLLLALCIGPIQKKIARARAAK